MKNNSKRNRKARPIHSIDPDEIRRNVDQLGGGVDKESVFLFASRLNELLESKGMTGEQLAKRIIGSPAAISKYKKGKGKPVSATLKKIAEKLDVSTDYLSGLTDLKSPDTADKNVHAVTGLSDGAINGLKKFKLGSEVPLTADSRLDAIKYLLEQEEDVDASGPSNPSDPKEEERFEAYVNAWYEERTKLLTDIADFLLIKPNRTNTNPVHITYEGIKEDSELKDGMLGKLQIKKEVMEDEIIDTIYIDRIITKLKKLKQDYQQSNRDRS